MWERERVFDSPEVLTISVTVRKASMARKATTAKSTFSSGFNFLTIERRSSDRLLLLNSKIDT